MLVSKFSNICAFVRYIGVDLNVYMLGGHFWAHFYLNLCPYIYISTALPVNFFVSYFLSCLQQYLDSRGLEKLANLQNRPFGRKWSWENVT